MRNQVEVDADFSFFTSSLNVVKSATEGESGWTWGDNSAGIGDQSEVAVCISTESFGI